MPARSLAPPPPPYDRSRLVVGSEAAEVAELPAAAAQPRIGFIGTGTMSSAMVRGLSTLDPPMRTITISPRGARNAGQLAIEFMGTVTVATDNQQVLDLSDVIFIGILPEITSATLTALRFEPHHIVISMVAIGAPLRSLKQWCAPASQIVRAIPLPAVAHHAGATVLAPPHPVARELFGALGTVVPLVDEEALTKMMPVTALAGHVYAQQRATQQWLQAQVFLLSHSAHFPPLVTPHSSLHLTPHLCLGHRERSGCVVCGRHLPYNHSRLRWSRSSRDV